MERSSSLQNSAPIITFVGRGANWINFNKRKPVKQNPKVAAESSIL